MPAYIAVALVTLLYLCVDLAPRRYRLPLSAVLALAIGDAFVWADLSASSFGPRGYTGIILVLLGLTLTVLTLRIRIPSSDEPTADTDDALFVPARLITGWWAWGAIEGFLILDHLRLRFVTTTGRLSFDVDLRHAAVSSMPISERGDLRIETETGDHAIALGHFFVGFGELREKRDFWTEAIHHRARTAA